ncbi:cytochrome c, mono- and diheme variant [unidentified eubacterium SCB49]|nr:cytochrome c, mono- and diheme variant [unidentified eubacterium SCB49]
MKSAAYLRIVGFAIVGYFVLDFAGSTGETSIFTEQPWLWILLAVIMLFYIAGEIIVSTLGSILYRTLSPEQQLAYDKDEALEKANQFKGIKEAYKNLLGSKPIEEEATIVLDHNYDGIRELDNKLPPWWVYGFYASIIFAVVYLVRFEVLGGENQHEEYLAAVEQAELDLIEYKKTAKDLVDFETVELLTEASDLNAGKAVFTSNCIACHKATGAGGIGPNLTDEYWILGGGIKNVFKTISEGGRAGKGMVSWKNDLKPSEIAQVASYVLSLTGTNPEDPKAPEGEIWVDPSLQVEAAETVETTEETATETEETAEL